MPTLFQKKIPSLFVASNDRAVFEKKASTPWLEHTRRAERWQTRIAQSAAALTAFEWKGETIRSAYR